MSRISIRDILAAMGESVTVEMDDGEEPLSVAVIVKTLGEDGKVRLRTGGTSDGELLEWPGACKADDSFRPENIRWATAADPLPSKTPGKQ